MIGRPETHPVKKVIGFTEEMIAAVESWRAKQNPVPNLSEAIRCLVELGLKATTPAKLVSKASNKTRAAELAAKVVDKIVDPTAPADERDRRRRRLTK
jgi:hypothetical protein